MSHCEHCGENAFDDDESVCTACGVVNQAAIELQTDITSSFKFNSYENGSQKPKPDALVHGLKTLNHLCHSFGVSKNVKTDSSTLLTSVYYHKKNGKKMFKTKDDVGILGGCCLMNIQSKSGCKLTMTNLCSALHCTKKKAFKMSKVLQIYLLDKSSPLQQNDVDSPVQLSDSIKGKEYEKDDFNSSELQPIASNLLCNIPEDMKDELIDKTVSLFKLASSCWLLTGRSRIGLMSGSAYLCWQAMHPKKKISLSGFCESYSINYPKARLRVPELKTMLLKLGSKIPSVTKNYVTEKNLLYHLDYILENSESLRNDLLTNEYSEDAMSKKEFETFRSSYLKPAKPKISVISPYDDNMNASEIEISDTEISSYIRTDEQINVIKMLKNM